MPILREGRLDALSLYFFLQQDLECCEIIQLPLLAIQLKTLLIPQRKKESKIFCRK